MESRDGVVSSGYKPEKKSISRSTRVKALAVAAKLAVMHSVMIMHGHCAIQVATPSMKRIEQLSRPPLHWLYASQPPCVDCQTPVGAGELLPKALNFSKLGEFHIYVLVFWNCWRPQGPRRV